MNLLLARTAVDGAARGRRLKLLKVLVLGFRHRFPSSGLHQGRGPGLLLLWWAANREALRSAAAVLRAAPAELEQVRVALKLLAIPWAGEALPSSLAKIFVADEPWVAPRAAAELRDTLESLPDDCFSSVAPGLRDAADALSRSPKPLPRLAALELLEFDAMRSGPDWTAAEGAPGAPLGRLLDDDDGGVRARARWLEAALERGPDGSPDRADLCF